ncbi:insulinase family protein [Campylobacter sp. RM9344]|uniref:Insulinase family protein n=1 Tax=Campylobacter californiensis TaxID=1032243 RepID=A0AAW3ZU29_9BACT|nr:MULTISPECIES: pitrilysin family protein [unclassified Campylobacter]MBE2984359.1 insulinase family protein [Campylobacter sp. RM6883]MBE2985887.1 insulinase family protein [Campylobacter sp. RM12919]MBE2988088.1 insulinase family protein [Campylobacter sp. RM12920]MBE2994774.1 insulinase family protein [Campylobacter sp. RM6913]MBE3030151.1 insulinase family protein [Campylobacter sp. RM9344]
MIKFNKLKLANKLEIYHIPLNKGSKVINVDIFYKVGSRNEIMGKSGIAHMLEHLNFKSTKNLKTGEFDEIVKGFGGSNNASTGFDYTHYFIKCSNSNLEKSLELFAELMSNLSLKDKEFQPERDVVHEERRWRTDNNPIGYLYFRLFNNAFIYHPYHWTPIGFIKDIQNWNIKDIKEFHETYYQPQNAILLIVGDIGKKEAFRLAKEKFEHIKNKNKIPKLHCVEPEQDGAKRAIVYKDTQTQMLAIAYKIPPFNHDDQIGLNALSEYLSNGKSSILQRVLVDELQLVNQIYAYNLDSIDENLFIFLAICNPDVRAEDVEIKIKELINDLKENLVSDDDVLRVKNLIKSDFVYSFDSSARVANLYGSYLARGDISPLYKFEENIENIDANMLKQTAQKYFVDKKSTTIILKKEEQ